MKTFTFRLQTVLNYRMREEEQAQAAYAQAQQAQARIEADIRQAGAIIEAYHTALLAAREGASNRQKQLVFLNSLQHQQTLCDRLSARLLPAQREVAARREAMLGARQRREALTLLKAKQQAAHNSGAARAEESMLGDLVTARHALGIMGAAA